MELEPRITALEKDVALVKAEQSYLRLHCATKEDLLSTKVELKQEIHNSTWRLVGFNIGFNTLTVTAVYFIATLVH